MHEAAGRAPVGDALAVNLIKNMEEAMRSQMAEFKVEIMTRIRVVQEDNDRKIEEFKQKIEEVKQENKDLKQEIEEAKNENKDIKKECEWAIAEIETINPRIYKLEADINDKVEEAIKDKVKNINEEFIQNKIEESIQDKLEEIIGYKVEEKFTSVRNELTDMLTQSHTRLAETKLVENKKWNDDIDKCSGNVETNNAIINALSEQCAAKFENYRGGVVHLDSLIATLNNSIKEQVKHISDDHDQLKADIRNGMHTD